MSNRDNIQSPNIEKLIPQQMVGDSQALIEFLKEYYRFLNQTNQPINVINQIVKNRDLDFAVDSYVDMIRKELGYGIAKDLQANKINLYKNIDQFYKAKGSIESFKLLFRLLFNKNVEIGLPKEQILIASDGRWIQQISLFANITSGNAFDLVNNFITINNTNAASVNVEVERVRKYNDYGIYEIVISRLFVGEILSGATFNQNGIEGTLVDSLSNATVNYSGSTIFKVGQLLDVVVGNEEGTRIKITGVNSSNGITSIEFLEFGANYPDLVALQLEVDASSLNNSRLLGNVISDTSEANLEAVRLAEPEKAILIFQNSPISKYSGSYSTNKGFLSDDIYLQDNYYYQQFSYVIKADEQFSQYEGIVKQTIHPTGMIMFGEFEITNEFDATAGIELLGRLYRGNYNDTVRTDQEIQQKTVIKPLEHSATTSQFVYYEFTKILEDTSVTLSDTHYELSKPLSNIVLTPDAVGITQGKPFYDSVHIDDDPVFEDLETVYALEYFAEEYSEGLTVDRTRGFYWELTKAITEVMNASDFEYRNITKSIENSVINSDTQSMSLTKPFYDGSDADDISYIDYTKPFEETINSSDSYNPTLQKPFEETMTTSEVDPVFNIDKAISETITAIENRNHHISKPLAQEHINNTEFGTVEINPYSAFYFSESYVEGHTAFS